MCLRQARDRVRSSVTETVVGARAVQLSSCQIRSIATCVPKVPPRGLTGVGHRGQGVQSRIRGRSQQPDDKF